MKSKTFVRAGVLCGAIFPAIAWAAFAVGGVAFTKRVETSLLAEPLPLSEPTGRVAYATKLNIQEVRGRWLRVTDGKTSGWVFSGNVAEEAPVEKTGLDGLPLAASATSATAAARPLAPAAEEYGTRRGFTTEAEDMTWIAQSSAAVTEADVDAYLQAQKKGEFQ